MKIIKPLNADQLDASQPGPWERRLQYIPLLGWSFSAALYQERIKPIVNDIKEQLKEREGLDVRQFWQEEDWLIVSKLLEIIDKTMEWKSHLFIPEDPCRIVFWAYIDCLDAVEAKDLSEKDFKMTFTESEMEETEHFTLQNLVNLIKIKGGSNN